MLFCLLSSYAASKRFASGAVLSVGKEPEYLTHVVSHLIFTSFFLPTSFSDLEQQGYGLIHTGFIL